MLINLTVTLKLFSKGGVGFFEICDEDNSGTIDKKEFYNLLKLSIVDYEDRSSLRNFVNEIFQTVDKNGNGELTK